MFDLSIFIPTHYAGPRHYAVIMQACELARTNPNIEVVVSDNSENPEKFAFLSSFASDNFRLVKGPSMENHVFALGQTTGRYLMVVGDDDTLLPASIPTMMRDLTGSNGFVGAIGQFGRELDSGYDFHNLRGIDAQSFDGRVAGIAGTVGLGNPLFHAIVARDILLKGYKLWVSLPNIMSHHDQLATLFVACSGPLKIMAQPWFIYNIQNHLRTATVDTELRHAKTLGHPVSLWILSRLMLAVEGSFLIGSPDFLAPEDQKRAAISAWFRGWHAAWQHSIHDNYYARPEFAECPAAPHVVALAQKYVASNQLDPNVLLGEIAGMYEKINGSGEGYRRFWTRMASEGLAAATAG
ncbi:glycosyltransferase family 2 protein [Paraburkholderia metrosideri]|uniref:Glycosyltransferase n=1 Tax=Paraburkholderia metrosideri TaxID=580937 RepID=A0ABN7HXT1_9BURK|nr:hypothetical protein [Paraburkholderia metrosideri]CAD6540185.1 hypothetical protein LMG28140_03469 [Paraburkholderia metrosideri]